MKKFVVILVIVAIVVADLEMSDINVIPAVLTLGAACGICALIDYIGRERKHTTSITHAARANRQRFTSRLGSSFEHQSWDGLQRYSQELQCAK